MRRRIQDPLFFTLFSAPRSSAGDRISAELRRAISEDVRLIVQERLRNLSRDELSNAFREAREHALR